MKIYMEPGEYSHFGKRKIRCKEVSTELAPREWYCQQCIFNGSVLCHWLRCLKRDRPDRKDVIFVYSKVREKK